MCQDVTHIHFQPNLPGTQQNTFTDVPLSSSTWTGGCPHCPALVRCPHGSRAPELQPQPRSAVRRVVSPTQGTFEPNHITKLHTLYRDLSVQMQALLGDRPVRPAAGLDLHPFVVETWPECLWKANPSLWLLALWVPLWYYLKTCSSVLAQFHIANNTEFELKKLNNFTFWELKESVMCQTLSRKS